MRKRVKLKLHRETLRGLNEGEFKKAEGGIYPPQDPSMYNSCTPTACRCSLYCAY
jgi:hypothetical protein